MDYIRLDNTELGSCQLVVKVNMEYYIGDQTGDEELYPSYLQSAWFLRDNKYVRLRVCMLEQIYLETLDEVKIGYLKFLHPLEVILLDPYTDLSANVKRLLHVRRHIAFNVIMSYKKLRPKRKVRRMLKKQGKPCNLFTVEDWIREKYVADDHNKVHLLSKYTQFTLL